MREGGKQGNEGKWRRILARYLFKVERGNDLGRKGHSTVSARPLKISGMEVKLLASCFGR